MKLTLTIQDERAKPRAAMYSTPQTEEYVRTEVSVTGHKRLIADALRAVANEIDPPNQGSDKRQYALGGILR